jgi:hypothetical protein
LLPGWLFLCHVTEVVVTELARWHCCCSRVAAGGYKEFWPNGQPDFWGSPPEQSAESSNAGGNDWNDLRGDNSNRYVVCKSWSEWGHCHAVRINQLQPRRESRMAGETPAG